ncbi:hypothetical protein H2201_002911 [Coniosporium apollinis]|uniref:DUF1941-domain-containing protein n=2 Tax=Coniosporium TaxID=2810619 RepID=A0ABQ9NZD3_9PEZI|nr:hypothetical protein H2199_006460 [Cladosporium sp. JES 115]KAJ9667076.1 hypothetical protein H2201_002911 [Coniosporium apollinis]
MESEVQQLPQGEAEQSQPSTMRVSLEQVLSYLKKKDDTSRFLGLTLLRPLVDNESFRNNPEAISECWTALSTSYLKRLLRAGQNEERSQAESRLLVDLAVGVLHAFSQLLPQEALESEKMISMSEGLVHSLIDANPDTTENALRTLLVVCSTRKGTIALLELEDLSPLVEICPQQPLALHCVKLMLLPVDEEAGAGDWSKKHSIITKLLLAYQGADTTPAHAMLSDVLMGAEFPETPPWLTLLISSVQKTFHRSPSGKAYKPTVILLANLTQHIPDTSTIWTETPASSEDPSTSTSNNKPFAYLFIKATTIDIEATVPSLIELLREPTYKETAVRLSAAYTVLHGFLRFLVGLPEDQESFMEPELLLNLYKEIDKTMSLTIEFLQDRWDAANAEGTNAGEANAEGTLLPPKRRSSMELSEASKEEVLSVKRRVTSDPIFTAAASALAFWLAENDNEKLRDEAEEIMEILGSLHSTEGA